MRPRMVVVAGPSGAGKTRCFPTGALGVDAFNVDDRCAVIVGSYQGIPREVRRAVGAACERFVLDHVERGVSFAVETTMRTASAIEQAALAKARGLATELLFLATDDLDEQIARVVQRAQAGGHAAPEAELREIHRASLGHLGRALGTFERAWLYDTTPRWTPPRLVAVSTAGTLSCRGTTPAWLTSAVGPG